jgi:hypothetical protein
VELSHWRVGLSVCPRAYESSGFELLACGGQTVGRVHARAFGFDRNGSAADLTYALHLGPALRLRLMGPFALGAMLGAEFPLTRNNYVADPGRGRLFRAAPVTGVARLGLSAEL